MSIVPMTATDADAMVALTTLAFPGFFRERTHEMGKYYGIRIGGELVAMAGEKGYARALMNCLLREHADAGFRSFLHVGVRNTRAVALYERTGFALAGAITLSPLSLAN